MIPSEIEYKEITQSEPTTLFKVVENIQNNSRLGLTALMVLSMATNTFSENLTYGKKDINFDRIVRDSYTNLEIPNSNNTKFEIDIFQEGFSEDYTDFIIKPIYSEEFKIKVKSFKIEKFVPSSI
ncbi:hypothetical protein FLAV_00892 [Flavobacteriales bacterium]|nr:hypothetical protein FLAV_00892 [Flavobacteriales bacterium]